MLRTGGIKVEWLPSVMFLGQRSGLEVQNLAALQCSGYE